ncbi:MAG: AmmeMemoRadiSam system radical SAM enzyme [Lachnospiraceae bacterium]|nr:AmmeMemoRadiSam system radical SAM enzyme [Lachnospiraceae bacterium]
MAAICDVCFRKCTLEAGQTGVCGARISVDGEKVTLANHSLLTSIALDPIEKKPLNRFFPGSMILSVGSFGCNLKCPFCQNVEISMADGRKAPRTEYFSPQILAELAAKYQKDGNIGIAFTYNEPLVGYEFVAETEKLVREKKLRTVLVTNGCVTDRVADTVLPLTDALNIDLKSFSPDYYREVLKGDLDMVRSFIVRAVSCCHVELTQLIIPGENDSEEEMLQLSAWVGKLEQRFDKKIPLHVTRFFPMSRYAERMPTPVETIYRLADVARRNLQFVYEGNV